LYSPYFYRLKIHVTPGLACITKSLKTHNLGREGLIRGLLIRIHTLQEIRADSPQWCHINI
jgi:hypothetical protein